MPSSLPCLHTFWHHPYIFLHFNVFYFLVYIVVQQKPTNFVLDHGFIGLSYYVEKVGVTGSYFSEDMQYIACIIYTHCHTGICVL